MRVTKHKRSQASTDKEKLEKEDSSGITSVVVRVGERGLTASGDEGTSGKTDMSAVMCSACYTTARRQQTHQSVHVKLVNFIVLEIITQ